MLRVMLLTLAALLISGGVSYAQDACRVDQVLMPGDSCTVDVPGVSLGSNEFRVTPEGRGCYGGLCSGGTVNISGFVASKIGGTSNWRIDALPQTDEPPPTPTPAVPTVGLLLLGALLAARGVWNRRH